MDEDQSVKQRSASRNGDLRLHARIKGRVQGVGFRAFTQKHAQRYGLTGWVRNRWDGTVEVVAEGPKLQLERLLQALQRGPFSGTTRQVKTNWLDSSGEFSTFQIRMTR